MAWYVTMMKVEMLLFYKDLIFTGWGHSGKIWVQYNTLRSHCKNDFSLLASMPICKIVGHFQTVLTKQFPRLNDLTQSWSSLWDNFYDISNCWVENAKRSHNMGANLFWMFSRGKHRVEIMQVNGYSSPKIVHGTWLGIKYNILKFTWPGAYLLWLVST